MLAKYHRMPEWLRWILLLPLTLLLTAGICEAAAWILGRHYFVVRQVFAVSSFVLFIYLFAPRWQKSFALGALIARIVLIGGVIAIGLASGNPLTEGVWIDLGRDFLGWAAAFVLFRVLIFTRVRSEEKMPIKIITAQRASRVAD